ncbi:metal-dependent phosphohydrolase [Spongiactinospora sp. TRM90649]|uniref:HD domain-containing protein n=1 Tax=Spongiactinospora sp. TRM90649 TaxID=3031114 RepID=UPI0023F7834F|nr:metal-dependent phosphohydrolase [Spongiactinospora sp. TRM90649]MDF5752092.1 metal-dependent phosphohydrolase [Spongiactinospora sp. TRM90649]
MDEAEDLAEDLIAGWPSLAGGSPASLEVAADLAARWAEPHRRYHTTAHLRAVLEAITPLAAYAADPVAVRLAAWFHDAVYDGVPGQDEERSARLALRLLPRCDVPPPRVDETARLVRLTATHDPEEGDANGAVLCDADLAVLASPGYDGYARAVREEYRHVPDDAFRAGRAAVLRRLLAAPRLYRTATAHDLWEATARANLAAELAALSGPSAAADPTPPA